MHYAPGQIPKIKKYQKDIYTQLRDIVLRVLYYVYSIHHM
jgi:hypothetical protein